jgi:alpha-tubulin suppressor-like RCC1 family protein
MVVAGVAPLLAALAGGCRSIDAVPSEAAVGRVIVTLAPASAAAHQTVQATAVPQDAAGNMLTGRIVTWSSSDTTIATVSASGLVTSISIGYTNIVATIDGTIGQLSFRVHGPSVIWASIHTGGDYTCAVTVAGTAYCWGYGGDGELGTGVSQVVNTVPTAVAGGLRFASVGAGDAASCGLTVSGALYCWGVDLFGPSADGSRSNTPLPFADSLRFASISVGSGHACGVATTGAAWCWGAGTDGALGNGLAANSATPVAVSGGLTFTAVSAGEPSCGLTVSGAAYCWGSNDFGQLGTGLTMNSTVPTPVSGQLTFASLTVGAAATCGVTVAGTAYCWGLDLLRYGSGNRSSAPAAIPAWLSLTSVSTGDGHSCGITPTGAAYCWGDGANGDLGNGSSTVAPAPSGPAAVMGGLTFRSISVANRTSCGITVDGAAYCWGDNTYGQLGTGSTTSSNVPVQVAVP